MFYKAYAFNQPLNWNVSSAKYVQQMFYAAYAFNQSLATWNLQSVTYMYGMFQHVRCWLKETARGRPQSLSGLPPRDARGLARAGRSDAHGPCAA